MTYGYGTLSARVYDLDKPVGTSFGDVEFYLRALQGVSGVILEPGVGTGRMLIPLLEAGLQVEGSDTAPDMLKICRDSCRSRDLEPVLHEVDMAGFVAPSRYQAIVIPAGTFALVTGRGRAEAALRNMRESLTCGGRLIVDLDPPSFDTAPGPMRHWRDGEDLLTLHTQHVETDPVAQQTTSWLRYELWRAGRLILTELQLFKLRQYGLAEFTSMLAVAGFTTVGVCGNHQEGKAPDPTSHVWTFQAS
jgi:ubiquinone/menaquinone biosynthesis C-methylase UbiE